MKLPQGLDIFSRVYLLVQKPGEVNDTFCSNIKLHFYQNATEYKVNFTNIDDIFCFINLYQNDIIKEITGNATEAGFDIDDFLIYLRKSIYVYGLDKTMIV